MHSETWKFQHLSFYVISVLTNYIKGLFFQKSLPYNRSLLKHISLDFSSATHDFDTLRIKLII